MTDINATPHAFEQLVGTDWPTNDWARISILVAVSGGPDSIALLRALVQNRRRDEPRCGTIHVAHFNHGWRGEASELDESFVRHCSQQLGLPFHVGRSTHAEKKEEIARSERYAFLRTTAENVGARYLSLAHTANDQAETILHRILRGTALRGLAGIPSRRRLGEAVTICRPILRATRQDVLGYLDDIGQPFRIDESNSDPDFTRNRIRHELLPQLAKHYNPEVIQSLLRLGKLANEANQFIELEAQRHRSVCVVEQSENAVQIDGVALRRAPRHLQKQTLIAVWRGQAWPEQAMGFDQWEQLIQAIDTGSTICLPGGIRIMTQDDVIRLTRFDS